MSQVGTKVEQTAPPARGPRACDDLRMTTTSGNDQTVSTIQRIRAMPTAEAMRLARSPDSQERIALERIHGKLAWEPLLRNPGLSIPEVLRIASMGMLPGPLIDIICN